MTLGSGAPVPLSSVLSTRTLIQRCRNAPPIHTSGCARIVTNLLTYRRSDPAAQGDSLNKLMLAGLVAVLGFAPAFALAQAQEKTLVGQVQSVDETGTKITLTDGTKLLTPLGSVIRPRALQGGTMLVAMYLEENGDKIVTKLSLWQSAPAPSTPSESPKR